MGQMPSLLKNGDEWQCCSGQCSWRRFDNVVFQDPHKDLKAPGGGSWSPIPIMCGRCPEILKKQHEDSTLQHCGK